MLKKKQFVVGKWGDYQPKKWGYLYSPDAPGKYPVVVFFHGLGANSVDGFLNEGVFKPINSGWKPNYVFMAIAGEGAYPPDPNEMKYALENDPEVNWDGVNVMWTGLSQGGFSTLQCAANGFPGVFVPMSSPAFDPSKIDGSKTYKAWVFHSVNDTQCPLVNAAGAYAKLKPYKITTPNDGHGNWNLYYDPNSPYGNIYEWAFGSVAPVPPVTPTKVLDYTIKFYKDGTFEKS